MRLAGVMLDGMQNRVSNPILISVGMQSVMFITGAHYDKDTRKIRRAIAGDEIAVDEFDGWFAACKKAGYFRYALSEGELAVWQQWVKSTLEDYQRNELYRKVTEQLDKDRLDVDWAEWQKRQKSNELTLLGEPVIPAQEAPTRGKRRTKPVTSDAGMY
jgi:hypothetical protein